MPSSKTESSRRRKSRPVGKPVARNEDLPLPGDGRNKGPLVYQGDNCLFGLSFEPFRFPTPGGALPGSSDRGVGVRSFEAPRLPSGRISEPTEESVVDEAWIQRIQQGDEPSARALIERLYPTILKTVRCHLPRRTAEEDLVQVIFSRLFANLHQFSGTVPIEHWVSRIAVNTCINQLKHEAVRRELRMSDLSEEEQAVVERLASTTEEPREDLSAAARELVETLMTRLKADERLVVTLLYLEERSVKEISKVTGWSVSLVKVKAFRCRHKMRRVWKTLLNSQRP
jgi:RNA polymerase sigma factor (sigma-70 family)